MTLEDVIHDLETLENTLTICVQRFPVWTCSSEAALVVHADVPGRNNFPYFLEVYVAKDVLRAWSFARDGKTPNLAEKCEALIYYAENDAYLLPA